MSGQTRLRVRVKPAPKKLVARKTHSGSVVRVVHAEERDANTKALLAQNEQVEDLFGDFPDTAPEEPPAEAEDQPLFPLEPAPEADADPLPDTAQPEITPPAEQPEAAVPPPLSPEVQEPGPIELPDLVPEAEEPLEPPVAVPPRERLPDLDLRPGVRPPPPGALGEAVPLPADLCANDRYGCQVAAELFADDTLRNIGPAIDLDGAEGRDFPCICPLEEQDYAGRHWAPTIYQWKASSMCHKPLYFEQVAVERYGHTTWCQPVVSAAHFFATIPVLPYKMGMNPPWECIYTLGYYRPGNCAPYIVPPVPISVRGAIIQAGVTTGLIYAIP